MILQLQYTIPLCHMKWHTDQSSNSNNLVCSSKMRSLWSRVITPSHAAIGSRRKMPWRRWSVHMFKHPLLLTDSRELHRISKDGTGLLISWFNSNQNACRTNHSVFTTTVVCYLSRKSPEFPRCEWKPSENPPDGTKMPAVCYSKSNTLFNFS